MEEQEKILFIWVPVSKCVFKTRLDSMHGPRKKISRTILMATMLLSMWPGRQMGINFVSKSYLALARYIKCDIKLSRRSYC